MNRRAFLKTCLGGLAAAAAPLAAMAAVGQSEQYGESPMMRAWLNAASSGTSFVQEYPVDGILKHQQLLEAARRCYERDMAKLLSHYPSVSVGRKEFRKVTVNFENGKLRFTEVPI